jgi:hypothetical protein
MNLDEDQLISLNNGVQLFNNAEFYEAHEYFEELWMQMNEEDERGLFLFLVRLAAAGVHLSNESFSSLFLYQLASKQVLADEITKLFNYQELIINLNLLINNLENTDRKDLLSFVQKTGLCLQFKKSFIEFNQ